MGRVNKYRKIKACDPFSKRKLNNGKETSYDEPPDLFDERAKKKSRTRELSWDNDKDRELLLQQQAVRELKASKSMKAESATNANLKIRDGESLESFRRRVKAETRKILVTELTKLNSSNIKKKEKLKQLKEKRKVKKAKKPVEEVMEFGSREDGYIRPSDRGDSKTEFDNCESIGFGERVDRPPDLAKFASKFVKKPPQSNREQQLEEVRQEAVLAYQKLREKRRAEAHA